MIKRGSLRESTHPLPWVSLKLILTHCIKNTAFRATENIFLGLQIRNLHNFKRLSWSIGGHHSHLTCFQLVCPMEHSVSAVIPKGSGSQEDWTQQQPGE